MAVALQKKGYQTAHAVETAMDHTIKAFPEVYLHLNDWSIECREKSLQCAKMNSFMRTQVHDFICKHNMVKQKLSLQELEKYIMYFRRMPCDDMINYSVKLEKALELFEQACRFVQIYMLYLEKPTPFERRLSNLEQKEQWNQKEIRLAIDSAMKTIQLRWSTARLSKEWKEFDKIDLGNTGCYKCNWLDQLHSKHERLHNVKFKLNGELPAAVPTLINQAIESFASIKAQDGKN